MQVLLNVHYDSDMSAAAAFAELVRKDGPKVLQQCCGSGRLKSSQSPKSIGDNEQSHAIKSVAADGCLIPSSDCMPQSLAESPSSQVTCRIKANETSSHLEALRIPESLTAKVDHVSHTLNSEQQQQPESSATQCTTTAPASTSVQAGSTPAVSNSPSTLSTPRVSILDAACSSFKHDVSKPCVSGDAAGCLNGPACSSAEDANAPIAAGMQGRPEASGCAPASKPADDGASHGSGVVGLMAGLESASDPLDIRVKEADQNARAMVEVPETPQPHGRALALPYSEYRLVYSDGQPAERLDKHPFAMSR